jgi:phosphoglycerol geranylgeranyltransferase
MVYQQIIEARGKAKKQLCLLIDPDKTNEDYLRRILHLSKKHTIDYILLGGSHISGHFELVARAIKRQSDIPLLIFPGSMLQLSSYADGILLLSLISGRNPEFLIGHHVVAAPKIKQSGLEIIPTGYMLIEGGQLSSVEYMSNTRPIPAKKSSIAVATAMAGEMLGLKITYLEAGSGAINPIPAEMISAIRENTSIPLVVGGGIRTAKEAETACENGADLIVIGTAFEQKPELIADIASAVKQA